ncbi:MAG: hypothetical protein PHD25_01815 [Bacteroidales bacterium]|nr:hypothetical protein [Bacteroidales bacterium]
MSHFERLPMMVASATPRMPISGNGPQPKMRQGSSRMLIRLATSSTRMETAASPALRKTALMMKSSMMTAFPPIIREVLLDRCRISWVEVPMIISSFSLNSQPGMPMTIETATAAMIAWKAVLDAPSLSFSPMRRDTRAVVAMLIPQAIA